MRLHAGGTEECQLRELGCTSDKVDLLSTKCCAESIERETVVIQHIKACALRLSPLNIVVIAKSDNDATGILSLTGLVVVCLIQIAGPEVRMRTKGEEIGMRS